MGIIRTPKPVYFKYGVIVFFVRNKIINYNTLIWSEDGTSQFLFERGIYENNSDELIQKVNDAFVRISK